MKKFWVLILTTIMSITLGFTLQAQTTIGIQDFESPAGTPIWTITAGAANMSSTTGSSDTPANQRIRNGTQSWQVNNNTATLELEDISISGYTNVKIIIYISSTSLTSGNGADAADYIRVFTALNGGSFPTNTESNSDITLKGNNNARWGFDALLTASTTAGTNLVVQAPQGGTNTNNYTVLEINIPNGNNSIALQIITLNDNGDEIWNIDDIKIESLGNNTSVQFASSTASVSEGDGTYNLDVSITNEDATNATTADVTLISGDAADLDNYTSQQVNFPAGISTNQTVVITITDDSSVEGSESFIFELQNIAGGNLAAIGSPSQFALTVNDNDIPDLVINEILADPDAINGDANGDGTVNITEDEFVEIINNELSSLDISNWTLEDMVGLKHTFPNSTIIPSGKAIVVFGGGTPAGIPGIIQTASSGGLGLNNSGDSVILKNSSGITIIAETYGAEGGDNQSLAREPDITGSFAKHLSITTNSVNQSPGRDNTDNSPLPVELTSFSAIIAEGKIKLNWRTETEVNNYGFEVERKTQEVRSEKWEQIGFVDGYGNSNSPKEYSFMDENVLGGKYSYRLKQIDNDGTVEYSKVIEVNMHKPIEFELSQNYPNPFNPETTIKFTIPKAGFVKLSYYNILGELKGFLVNEFKEAGIHTVNLNASELNSGVYVYKLEIDNFVQMRKMNLIK